CFLVRRAILQCKSTEQAKRKTVEQGFLQLGIGKVIKPLEIKRLEHSQCFIRRTADFSGANPLSQRFQNRPVDKTIHFFQLLVFAQPRIRKRFRKSKLLCHPPLLPVRNDGITESPLAPSRISQGNPNGERERTESAASAVRHMTRSHVERAGDEYFLELDPTLAQPLLVHVLSYGLGTG